MQWMLLINDSDSCGHFVLAAHKWRWTPGHAAVLFAGKVELLTHVRSAGYEQNPISVYYCHDIDGELRRCIAEVTNTPWAQRTVFAFEPSGDTVPKSLHVSPFQDMTSTW